MDEDGLEEEKEIDSFVTDAYEGDDLLSLRAFFSVFFSSDLCFLFVFTSGSDFVRLMFEDS